MIETEVLIIGGGPAGSACATRLVENGVPTILLDKHPFPRFKPCAGWLTPQVLKSLHLKPGEYPLGLTQYSSFDISIRAFHFRLPTHQYTIRRYEFDDWLLKHSGAEFHVHEVRNISSENDRYIVDGEFSARYLIGAGGTHCPVYQTYFKPLQQRDPAGLIVAMEEEFPYDGDPSCKLWFFEEDLPGYSWYIPKVNGYLNVGIGGAEAGLKKRGDALKDHWNKFVEKLDKRGLVRGHEYQPSGHSYYLHQKLPAGRVGNAFIVGDSLGLATLDMGEGIRPSIQSGLMAAEAILHGTAYRPDRIARYSFPSLFGLRR